MKALSSAQFYDTFFSERSVERCVKCRSSAEYSLQYVREFSCSCFSREKTIDIQQSQTREYSSPTFSDRSLRQVSDSSWIQRKNPCFHSRFGGGSGKTLTLDQVYNILMTLKHTGSWVEAFKFIP